LSQFRESAQELTALQRCRQNMLYFKFRLRFHVALVKQGTLKYKYLLLVCSWQFVIEVWGGDVVFGPGQLMHATHAVALGRMTCLAVCSTSFLLVLQQSVILKCN